MEKLTFNEMHNTRTQDFFPSMCRAVNETKVHDLLYLCAVFHQSSLIITNRKPKPRKKIWRKVKMEILPFVSSI